jgi:hypothetical protein
LKWPLGRREQPRTNLRKITRPETDAEGNVVAMIEEQVPQVVMVRNVNLSGAKGLAAELAKILAPTGEGERRLPHRGHFMRVSSRAIGKSRPRVQINVGTSMSM